MGAILGSGFNSTYSGGASTSAMLNSTSTEVTLDSNGRFSITLTNADTYSIISAVFQENPGAQSGIFRIDPSNTSALKGEADIGALANGKVAVITYSVV